MKSFFAALMIVCVASIANAQVNAPGAAPDGTALAEYNANNGELIISSTNVINVFVQSNGGNITPLNPAPPAPVGLLTNNVNRVGITNLGPIDITDHSFGSIGMDLAQADLELQYTKGFGQQPIKVAAGSAGFTYIPRVPEPGSLGLIGLGMAGLLAARRRS